MKTIHGNLNTLTQGVWRPEARAARLALKLGRKTVTFDSLTDFEFSLASRTGMPADKVGELMGRSAEDLKKQAANIRRVEKQFSDILAEALTESERIGVLMSEIDPKVFSHDHGWRQIMEMLKDKGPEYDPHRRVALAKYTQYLGSRARVLKSIYLQKVERADEEDAPGADPRLRETGIFELTQFAAPDDERAHLMRLPRGEPITVRVLERDGMALWLARHRFRLFAGASFYLVDEGGKNYGLKHGLNAVGRQNGLDVEIDHDYRDVSRRHLLVEILDGSRAKLTDLSSHGTFVPPDDVEAPTGE